MALHLILEIKYLEKKQELILKKQHPSTKNATRKINLSSLESTIMPNYNLIINKKKNIVIITVS